MKTTINIISKCSLYILFILPLFLVSCSDDDDHKTVRIDRVWTNKLDVETHVITTAFTQDWVRLEGTGFDGLKAIYCNGKSATVHPTYVTDKHITFQIPSGVPLATEIEDETVRNTIRIVTASGEAVYNDFIFKDATKMPNITNVSYTMPNVGDNIYIEGSYLSETTEIYFPGDIKALNFQVVNSNQINVTVPAGAGNVSGAIRIVCNGDDVYSPSYMFYKKGIFLKTFTEDVMVSGGNNGIKIYSNPVEIATTTGLNSNPEYMLAIPATKQDISVAGSNNISANFFKFFAYKGFNSVINASDGEIAGSTLTENLAIQFDLYMNQPWISGAIPLRMNKNNNGTNKAYVYNITPWQVLENNNIKPFNFASGWRSITVKFTDFPTLALGTLDDYINTITANNYEALIAFSNFDQNQDGHTARPITNFQMYIANIRLVPITKPVAE